MIFHKLSDSLGAIRDIWRFGQRAPGGRIFAHSQSLDSFRGYVADQLTPSRLKSLLRAADCGDLSTTLSLFQEMECKDARLKALARTRRGALTGLEWEVVSMAYTIDDESDKRIADEAASFVKEAFAELECFDDAIRHLATAIGPNLAVVELVWERSRLVDLVPIPSHRLRAESTDPTRVLVVTEDNRAGVPAAPPKFVVHVPETLVGFEFSRTLLHSTAMIYLIKLLALANWGSYCETFGQPVRWATWPPNTPPDERQAIIDMLKNMGSSAYGAFSQGVNLEIKESSQRGTSPFEGLIEFCNREQAIAWLGQNLTTDTTGGTGTFAAAKVHSDVRQDLLEDDVKAETQTVRSQIIAPMIAFNFSQARLFSKRRFLPTFRRRFREEVDRKLEAEVIGLAQSAGMRMPKDWAYDAVGIPKPDPDEAVLERPLDDFGENLTENVGVPV